MAALSASASSRTRCARSVPSLVHGPEASERRDLLVQAKDVVIGVSLVPPLTAQLVAQETHQDVGLVLGERQ